MVTYLSGVKKAETTKELLMKNFFKKVLTSKQTVFIIEKVD